MLTLHGKDGGHHATTNASGGKFRSDASAQRVITTDTDTHDKTPHDDDGEDGDGRTLTSDGLTQGADNDDLRQCLVSLKTRRRVGHDGDVP